MLHNFVLNGLKDAVGKQDKFWVLLNAASWSERGILTTDDLTEINALYEALESTDTTDDTGVTDDENN